MKLPTLVAHRGLHHQHSENTLPALDAAWAAGFTWAEIDLRASLEHEPFLLHDETLDRTTPGGGRIDQASRAKLIELGVPRFDELMASMPTHARLLVEIKPKVARLAVDRILELCDPSRCIVQSFDADLLRYAGDRRRDIELHLLVDDANEFEGGPWNAINADFNTLGETAAAQIRNVGFGVGVWTVNTVEDAKRMIELKVDRIITDEPVLLRDNLGQIG
jgi:glycerophosphoryl diester phosphodiesterase